MCRLSFILGSFRVPDHHVSISSRDDPAFPGVEVVDLGCIWACDCDKTIFIYFTSNLEITTERKFTMFAKSQKQLKTRLGENKTNAYHSFLPDHAHAVLNTRKAVRNLCEIVLAHSFLFDGERTVVWRHNVQTVTAETASSPINFCISGKDWHEVLLHAPI